MSTSAELRSMANCTSQAGGRGKQIAVCDALSVGQRRAMRMRESLWCRAVGRSSQPTSPSPSVSHSRKRSSTRPALDVSALAICSLTYEEEAERRHRSSQGSLGGPFGLLAWQSAWQSARLRPTGGHSRLTHGK